MFLRPVEQPLAQCADEGKDLLDGILAKDVDCDAARWTVTKPAYTLPRAPWTVTKPRGTMGRCPVGTSQGGKLNRLSPASQGPGLGRLHPRMHPKA